MPLSRASHRLSPPPTLHDTSSALELAVRRIGCRPPSSLLPVSAPIHVPKCPLGHMAKTRDRLYP